MKSMKTCNYHLSFLTVLVTTLYVKGQGTEKYNQFVNVARSSSTNCEQLNNTWKCPNLEKALNLSELSFTHIKIFTTSEKISKRIPIIGVDTLTITSAHKASKTLVKCSSDLNKMPKLSFINSSNIYMYGLSFESCGTNHSDDYIIVNTSKIDLSSAIYLKNVTNLTVNNSAFTGSRGYGVVMVDVMNALFYKTKVEANILMQLLNLSYGGGIIFVSSSIGLSNNNVTFTNCIFSKNCAIGDIESISTVKSNHDTKYFKERIHGNGGSLSFYFWNEKVSLNLAIRNSAINESRALQGGGIYIEFDKSSKGNVVDISNSSLNGSYAQYSGGAMHVYNKAKHSENNTIYIRQCVFWRNNAALAGAFLQKNSEKLPKYRDQSIHETVIKYCHFLENEGMLGSALYIESTALMLNSTNITNNTGSNATNSISSRYKNTTLLGVGVVFAFESKVYVNGTMEVSGNVNTAFVLSCSYLFLQGTAIFINNQRVTGGAISLYDESAIFLTDMTYLHFKSNKAIVGGALYVEVPGPVIPVWIFPEFNLYKCFFLFSQTTRKAFKGKVIFEDNFAGKNDGNAIFTNLLQTCQKSRFDDLSQVFLNWPNFIFTSNSSSFINTINTVPVEIIVNKSEWDDFQPGMKFSVNITLLDERGQSVEAPIDISFEPEDLVYVKNNRIIVSGKRIELEIFGIENTTFNVTIKTPSGRAKPYKIINKKLHFCNFGFFFTSMTNSCTCINIKNKDRMISRCDGKYVYLYKNVWAYPFQNAASIDEETTQVCPHGYCNLTCNHKKDSLDCKYNYHYQCAKNRNQSFNNYLCAKCSTNHSVVLGSEECRDCRKVNNWWAALLILLAIPALVVAILWVNVDIYRWLLNSLIFYYQVVYLLFIPQQHTNVVMGAFTGAVDLRNLGIDGTGFCLYDGFDNIRKILFNLSIPLLMIVTLAVIVILTEKCPCTLPWERVNTFRAILFVLMLAYSDITRITLDILDFVEINGEKRMTIFAVWKYMDGNHLFCAIPAFVILIVFVIGVPFALIAPSVAMTFEWKHCNRLIHNRFYISFVKPFLERFLSVFNNNLKCHLFFSFYFLFRLILLLMITFLKRDLFQLTLMTSFCFLMFLIFTIVRPYQNDIYNYFDIFILFNLTVIGFLSHGKLKLFLWDGKTIYIDWVIRVLLWVPLMTWMVVLIMLYRGAIRNNCLAIWVRFCNRHADIDE